MTLKMSDILKPGAKLKARKLSDSEVKETIAKAESEQAKSRKMKQIDWAKMETTIINI